MIILVASSASLASLDTLASFLRTSKKLAQAVTAYWVGKKYFLDHLSKFL